VRADPQQLPAIPKAEDELRFERSLTSMPRRRRPNGFVLLVVIWGLGIVSLLISSFMSNGSLRLQAAFNIASATQANFVAEGAINALIPALLLSEQDAGLPQAKHPPYDGAPRYCSFAGAAVALAVEDEGGKIDINSASPKLLQAMLMGFGIEAHEVDGIANAIAAFRSVPTGDGEAFRQIDGSTKPVPPKRALFQTIFELDQVGEIDARLFHELAPFITVHSRHPGIDSRSAPPALFAALAGFLAEDVEALKRTPFPNSLDRADPRFPRSFNQSSDRAAFLLHAETLLSTGQTAVREAIIDLRASGTGHYGIKEIRRGALKYIDQLRSLGTGAFALPDCRREAAGF
jgi:general secretion pathway protein K